jgi:ABC-type multidrug transport system fused ATPase/permease subunit
VSRVVDGSTIEVPAQRGAATTRRLLGETAAYKGELLLALGLIMLSAAAQAAAPWLVSRAIDSDILTGDARGLARTLAGLLAGLMVTTCAA